MNDFSTLPDCTLENMLPPLPIIPLPRPPRIPRMPRVPRPELRKDLSVNIWQKHLFADTIACVDDCYSDVTFGGSRHLVRA